ncbi:hypothetical protein OG302_22210 [Streptomyces sp. NBC_01283]|uniref:hypothetical protein n=1 Tax=Streptomyces sp. NBC_01283 TaxID=2903812 RepID=UPI00352F39C0|nr:hypothetical protein OG302_22210 [Streptomyces sp. NBC_01283]
MVRHAFVRDHRARRVGIAVAVSAVVVAGFGPLLPSALVVRDTSGNLCRNDGKGTGSFTARTKIATGWSGYKVLYQPLS